MERESSAPCKIIGTPLGNTQCGEPRGTQVKAERYLYRSGHAKRFPGGLDSQISRKLSHEVDKLSGLCTGRLYPQKIFLVFISVRGRDGAVVKVLRYIS